MRSKSLYVLRADIGDFYGSVYTHSIPWALHSKSTAKVIRDSSLFGNRIDTCVRNCQDGQTKGIPIGPDTSLLIGEIILSAVDGSLPTEIRNRGFRYMDDYEFCFWSRQEAVTAIAELQNALSKFELDLNPSKTEIIELPSPIEDAWASHLRILPISRRPKRQRYDLINFFSNAFAYFRDHKGAYILRYAISKLNSASIHRSNWELYQNFLIQCAVVEPGCMPFVYSQLLKYKRAGYSIANVHLEEVFNELMTKHAIVGHSSEVAWALWGCILFDVRIDKDSAYRVTKMDECVVALLTLHAHELGLVDSSADFSLWSGYMGPPDLRDSMWLLSYEAGIKKWLPSLTPTGIDHIAADPDFDFLRSNGVAFYDTTIANKLRAGSRRIPTPTIMPYP